MKERLEILELLQEELETLDESIWEVIMRIDDIAVENDYRVASKLVRIARKMEDARDAVQELTSEVLMEIEQHGY